MKAIDVARFFLGKANREGDLITNLKMQKLLYYAQAWYLVNYDRPLFSDELKAWDLGPVVEKVYREYKKFGSKPIEYRSTGTEESIFSDDDLEFLNEFYGKFISCSAHTLVNLSHSEQPWIDANKTSSKIMDLDKMGAFYSKQYDESHKE